MKSVAYSNAFHKVECIYLHQLDFFEKVLPAESPI
jgi:hypothetical protein